MKNKVFIIGIDGGTWNVLKPLMEEGKLPHLTKLVENGVSGNLISTIPPETASAWTTFQTGVNPGKHGIYSFLNYLKGEYNPSVINSRMIPLETIWQILSRHGRKVLAVNVPITYPPYKINGLMVTGMLTPSVKSNFTYPPELAEEILKVEKDYTIVTTQQVFNRMTFDRFIETLISTEEKRTKVVLYLLNKYEWDLAMIHFHSSDPLQHAVYWYLDKKSQFFNEEKYQIAQNFYRSLDNNIGKLLEILNEDTLKIIISDHGFCSVYKTININNFLIRNGFMTLKKKGLFNKRVLFILKILREIDRKFIKARLSYGKRFSLRKKLRLDKFIDWSKTKAMVINGWLYGFIYINCIGREKQGIVNQGEEYEDVRNSIIEKLASLKNPLTGEKVIKKICKREEIYKGEFLNKAPDLIAIPEKGYEFSRSFTRKTEDLFTENKIKRDHTGSHEREGIFIFEGNMIDKNKDFKTANIEDILPTILFFFDLKIPCYMDGRVLTEIFSKSFLKNKPLLFEEFEGAKYPFKDKEGYTEEEKKEIEKRLKELGYI